MCLVLETCYVFYLLTRARDLNSRKIVREATKWQMDLLISNFAIRLIISD